MVYYYAGRNIHVCIGVCETILDLYYVAVPRLDN